MSGVCLCTAHRSMVAKVFRIFFFFCILLDLSVGFFFPSILKSVINLNASKCYSAHLNKLHGAG